MSVTQTRSSASTVKFWLAGADTSLRGSHTAPASPAYCPAHFCCRRSRAAEMSLHGRKKMNRCGRPRMGGATKHPTTQAHKGALHIL
jgi:hypothetical protein